MNEPEVSVPSTSSAAAVASGKKLLAALVDGKVHSSAYAFPGRAVCAKMAMPIAGTIRLPPVISK